MMPLPWYVLALMGLGYVGVGLVVARFVESALVAYAAGVVTVVLCVYFTRRITGAERAEKFARYRARVQILERLFDNEIEIALATFNRIKGRHNENR
jgi:hypothetical protein